MRRVTGPQSTDVPKATVEGVREARRSAASIW